MRRTATESVISQEIANEILRAIDEEKSEI